MRRSRSTLTAWPAFADLMTVLAVLGFAIAADVASVDRPDRDLQTLEGELAAARESNARDSDRIRALETELAAARERDARDSDRIQALETELQTSETELTAARLGSVPCLGTRPGSRTAPVPLLRIVVDAGYRLTRLWPQETASAVAGIPQIEEAIAHGLMQEDDLIRYARGMRGVRECRRHPWRPVPLLGRAPKGRDDLARSVLAGEEHRGTVLPVHQLVRSDPHSCAAGLSE